mgnify:FL=1
MWGGLGATNNYAIDPSIGTLEDFEDLLREVHARDMRLTSLEMLVIAGIKLLSLKKHVMISVMVYIVRRGTGFISVIRS